MSIQLLVLNYNGRALLEECLPTIVRAAAAARGPCTVAVIDNDSTDDSRCWLAEHFPNVVVHHRPNRGLCSFNDVLVDLPCRIAVLLNNDIKLAEDAIDPLVAPLMTSTADDSKCWMTAPRCWLFDESTHEGFRTAVRWRWGMIQATARFPGNEAGRDTPGETASAGAVLAVDREDFLRLGGFDPLYLPGRLEDVDLAFRAHQAGYVARYVPASHAWHRGQATFDAALGSAASLDLALRNTLLFQWKNLRHPWHMLRQAFGLPLRVAFDLFRAPGQASGRRWNFIRALASASARLPEALRSTYREPVNLRRERNYFRRFGVPQMVRDTADDRAWQLDERRRMARHPISRRYLLPLVLHLVRKLSPTCVRPGHVTLVGLAAAIAAAGLLIVQPTWTPLAALVVWSTWFCDRIDGPLARLQKSTSEFGAWFDANVDELTDVGLQTATAWAAAAITQSALPWGALLMFVAGKYLFMHGLTNEPNEPSGQRENKSSSPYDLWRTLYHLPGNADVRMHLLLAALATGYLTAELLVVALYYNLRWIARYALVAKRMAAVESSGGAVV